VKGQKSDYYSLSAFHGTVYEMPEYSDNKGFKEGIEKFDSIGHIILPKLNFRPDYPDVHFPSFELKDRFAFTLNANLKIIKEACYRLTLVSDDGSLLWIDDELSIDNGGMHPWKMSRDTLALSIGEYDLRLWYYNAVGPCGLAIKIDSVDSSFCKASIEDLVTCISFDENEYLIDKENKEKINSLVTNLSDNGYKISVTGYADSIGTQAYNELLAARRANSVKKYLGEFLSFPVDSFEMSNGGEIIGLKNSIKSCKTDRSVVLKVIRK
jgi:hypothetical protein